KVIGGGETMDRTNDYSTKKETTDGVTGSGEAVLSKLSCSDGWFVTGYYTPSESEFHGPNGNVDIQDHGSDHFPAHFPNHVKIEGWGLTSHGWYVGWDRCWIQGDAPLNARWQPLQIGSVAVDRHVIPLGSQLQIPTLVPPWNAQLFVADDTGGAITGKHVDVY